MRFDEQRITQQTQERSRIGQRIEAVGPVSGAAPHIPSLQKRARRRQKYEWEANGDGKQAKDMENRTGISRRFPGRPGQDRKHKKTCREQRDVNSWDPRGTSKPNEPVGVQVSEQ